MSAKDELFVAWDGLVRDGRGDPPRGIVFEGPESAVGLFPPYEQTSGVVGEARLGT